VATHHKVLLANPWVMAWGAGAIAINLLDTFITGNYLDKVGPAIHVAWHLAAALALYKFNQAQVNAKLSAQNTPIAEESAKSIKFEC
jgi:hypothetical protein